MLTTNAPVTAGVSPTQGDIATMKRVSLSIPFAVDLTKESAWETLDDKCTSFGIVRCHFQLNERILNELHKVGSSLAVYKSPEGVGSQHVISSSFELEDIKQERSIHSFLEEHESVAKFATELASKLGFSKNELSAKIKADLVDRLKTSISSTNELFETSKVREVVSFEITNTIDPSITEPIVAVPAFKRKAYDLLLAYVDFLRVDYERSMFGLRKKAKKRPEIVDFNTHPNKLKFGVPLATIYYWEFLPKSSVLMLEKNHTVEVSDSEQVSIGYPEDEERKHVKFPNVPSLYQIANVAFPLKWVFRKPDNEQWSEEDLKKIELEEVKSQSNGWWQKYGLKG